MRVDGSPAYACGQCISEDQRVSIEFKGSHFEQDVILWGERWYVAYPISYRELEEMMEKRGAEVDHSMLNRWVLKYTPLFEQEFRRRKSPAGSQLANRRDPRESVRRLEVLVSSLTNPLIFVDPV
jgi:hypothetical protein